MIIALDYFFLVDDILAGQFGESKISAKSLFSTPFNTQMNPVCMVPFDK